MLAAAIKRGLEFVDRGDYRQAARRFEDALRIDPSHALAVMYLGSCHSALGEYQDAIEQFESFLALQPGNAQALTYMGAARQHLGRHDEAESAYRQALSLQPGFADAHGNLGRLMFSSGRVEEARSRFETAVGLQPSHQLALCGLAEIDEREGRLEEGLARLMPLIERGVAAPETLISAARLCRCCGEYEQSLNMLSALTDQSGLPYDNVVQARFAMGKSYDGLGQYAEAWSCFDEANRLKRVRYLPERLEAAVDRVIRVFAAEDESRTARSDGHQPVFLIGLPRSGKTLLEGLLARHPAVKACGELTKVGELSATISSGKLTYPEALAAIGQSSLDQCAEEYLQACGSLSDGETHTVDTLPGNFLHLGLIKTLFPNAAVIWCRRDPLDTALFCFFKNFSGDSFRFSFSQDHIVHYFAQFYRLMDHWLSFFGDAVHIVDYEALIEDPRRVLQRAFSRLGLPALDVADLPALRNDECGHHRHYASWIDTLSTGIGGPGEG